MDLWVRIFYVGINFLMVGGFKFFGFNGLTSVMAFQVGLVLPTVSFQDLAYLFYLWLQKKMENLLGSFQSKNIYIHIYIYIYIYMGSFFFFPLLFGFLFVGSIYIKREPIIVLIEQDLSLDMGFGFEDLISKMVREKSFFNMLLLILFLLWLIK